MWKSARLALICVIWALALSAGPRAQAQTANCPLPYLLQNNTVADATQVMANFNTLAACLSIGLTTTVNNGAMAVAQNSIGSVVYRSGFAAPNDGGGAYYMLKNGACTLNAGAGDGGSQVPASSGGNCWTILPNQPLNAQMWGADPSHVADSSAAFQAYVNYLGVLGGGVFNIPIGYYKVHDITAPAGGIHFIGGGKGPTPYHDGDVIPGNGATLLDCSAMTDHCIQLGPTVPSANRFIGGSIEKLATYNNGGSGFVFRVHQQLTAVIRDVWSANPPHCAEYYGNEEVTNETLDCRNVQADPVFEVWGDLSGKNGVGGACTSVGDCSTRQDLVTFTHVNAFPASNSVGFLYVHDQTFGTNGGWSTFEGGAYGLKVRCAGGQANIGACPQQLRWFDLENEGGVQPLDLQDFTYFECSHCFFSATGSSGHVGTASLVNYTQSDGGGGGFYLDNTQVFGATGSCLVLGVTDVHLDHNAIYGCDISANVGSNDAAVEFTGASNNNIISNNNFCQAIGATAGDAGIGLRFGVNTFRMNLSNNTYVGCTGNLVNSSSQAFSIYEVNPSPPPPVGTISGITGLGSLGTAQFLNGNEFAGLMLLVANGTGIASSGGLTMGFPQPLYPQALCFFQPANASGAWSPLLTSTGVSPTAYQVSWSGVSFPAGAAFTGSTSRTTLTTSSVSGTIVIGHTLQGVGVPMATQILSQLTGPAGGAGTYSLSTTPSPISPEAMNSGGGYILQYRCGGF